MVLLKFPLNNLIAFVNRNPRYVVLLVFFLTCSSTLLLLQRPSGSYTPIRGYLPSKFRGSMSLEEFVAQEEHRYSGLLADRHTLIKHYGPNPDQVDSFPQGDIFYTLWDFFIPAFNCPHRVDRLGALGDGGKWVCGVDRLATQHAPCIIYSFGINRDSSFEAALLQRAPNCEVWGYDFSVTIFGPEIHNNPVLSPKTHFSPYKLAAHDNAHRDPPDFTIQTLMQQNGHEFIDLLKVDIEGDEFDVMTSFLRPFVGATSPNLPIGQLEIEIHAWNDRGSFAPFYSWWLLMEKAGLRPFWTEPNIVHVSHLRNRPDVVEYSLLNVKGRHALVTSDY